jgi:hypothetical protein
LLNAGEIARPSQHHRAGALEQSARQRRVRRDDVDELADRARPLMHELEDLDPDARSSRKLIEQSQLLNGFLDHARVDGRAARSRPCGFRSRALRRLKWKAAAERAGGARARFAHAPPGMGTGNAERAIGSLMPRLECFQRRRPPRTAPESSLRECARSQCLHASQVARRAGRKL